MLLNIPTLLLTEAVQDTSDWRLVGSQIVVTSMNEYTVSYVIVAGGGGIIQYHSGLIIWYLWAF